VNSLNESKSLPILLLAYSRSDFIEHRLREISRIKPKLLFVSIDKHEDRSVTKSIQARISAFASEQNETAVTVVNRKSRQGLARHLPSALDQFLDENDKIFVVEDDISISRASYESISMQIIQTGLDSRIFSVGGFSPLSLPWNCSLTNSWRKTKYFSAWGWAIKKEVWQNPRPQLNSNFEALLRKSAVFNSLDKDQQNRWKSRFWKNLKYPDRTWDIPLQFACFALDYYHILPKYRIVDNLGFADTRAANTTATKPKWMLRESSFHKMIKTQQIHESPFLEMLDAYAIGGDVTKSGALLLAQKEIKRK
jgi:hypothetical protein